MLASTLTVMAGATIGPVLPLMTEVFADTPNADFLTRLILTMPALFIVIASPFCGWLTDRYGRKKLLIAGAVLYGLSGTAGAWLDSLTAILISRALLGISVASIMTVCITLIGDYYSGFQRQKITGLQSAFMAFGGVVFISAGGMLADISWRAPFLIYSFALLLLPAIMLFIKEPAQKSEVEVNADAGRDTSFSLLNVSVILAMAFLGMAMFYMIPVHIPFLIHTFGDISNTEVGLALSSFVLTGAIAALNYQRFLYVMSHQSIYVLSFFLLGIGYIMIFFSDSYAGIFAGLITGGAGSGLLKPNTTVWMLSEAPDYLRGRLSGMITTAVFLGQFLSPVLTRPLVENLSISEAFLFVGAGVTAISVSAALYLMISRRSSGTDRHQRSISN
ncbi:MFS transporter [Natronogracilivirga saccharolytica]|nr:MFS transporter [Natronogracilivirga saccharolytica]